MGEILSGGDFADAVDFHGFFGGLGAVNGEVLKDFVGEDFEGWNVPHHGGNLGSFLF